MTDNLAFALGLCAVAAFVYGPLQWFMVDLTRQQIFELRDSLFDHAAKNNLFQDERYVALRSFMNAAIRWADQANGLVIPSAVTFALLHPDALLRKDDLHEALRQEGVPPIYRESFERTMRLVTTCVVLRSPVALIMLSALALMLPFLAIAQALFWKRGKSRRFRNAVERVIEADVSVA